MDQLAFYACFLPFSAAFLWFIGVFLPRCEARLRNDFPDWPLWKDGRLERRLAGLVLLLAFLAFGIIGSLLPGASIRP